MNWIQGFVYGIISGISQFLPVPALANQSLLFKLFGIAHRDHLCDMIVHICILAALVTGTKGISDPVRRISSRGSNAGSIAENRFIKHATLGMVIFLVLFLIWVRLELNYLLVSLLLVVNGIIIFAPGRMYQGNKDARSMSSLDGILFGAANAFAVIPGLSGTGCSLSVAMMRGADRGRAGNWLLRLNISALALLSVADIILMISNFSSIPFGSFFTYALAGVSAYISGYFGMSLLKILLKRSNFHEFSFYSWGLSLLMLLLFLI